MLLVMAGIFFVSGIPGDRLPLPDVVDIDKLAHLTVYGLLAGTVFYAFGPRLRYKNPTWLSLVVIAVCIIYGISDEYHQSFIPNRTPSVFDILADGTGAIVVCLIRNSTFWKGLFL